MDDEKPLTVTEVAQILRVSDRVVLSLIRRKQLPAFRVGRSYRVYQSDVQQYIATHTSDKDDE